MSGVLEKQYMLLNMINKRLIKIENYLFNKGNANTTCRKHLLSSDISQLPDATNYVRKELGIVPNNEDSVKTVIISRNNDIFDNVEDAHVEDAHVNIETILIPAKAKPKAKKPKTKKTKTKPKVKAKAKKQKKGGGVRKLTAFQLYIQKEIPLYKQKHPNVPHREVFKTVAHMWKKK